MTDIELTQSGERMAELEAMEERLHTELDAWKADLDGWADRLTEAEGRLDDLLVECDHFAVKQIVDELPTDEASLEQIRRRVEQQAALGRIQHGHQTDPAAENLTWERDLRPTDRLFFDDDYEDMADPVAARQADERRHRARHDLLGAVRTAEAALSDAIVDAAGPQWHQALVRFDRARDALAETPAAFKEWELALVAYGEVFGSIPGVAGEQVDMMLKMINAD